MALLKPVDKPVNLASQCFGGHFWAEPPGWFARAAHDSRPLKCYATHFPGSIFAHDLHDAVDTYGAEGTPLRALEAGTVGFVGNDGAGGRQVKVNIQGHPGVRYGHDHCSAVLVKEGERVKRGQVIAKMGHTGNAKGDHDHLTLEILETGSDGVKRWMYYDPARFFPAHTFKWGTGPNGKYGPPGQVYLPGGDLAGDDRIYPIHNVVVAGPGTNVRQSPDRAAPVVTTTTAPITVPQLNVVHGGDWTVGAVHADTWAKVKYGGKAAYVATALIRPA